MAVNPHIDDTASEEATGRAPHAGVPGSNGAEVRTPRLIHRDGMAYVEGCDVPVWQIEMARRAGSPSAALLRVFPSLTPDGLGLAFAYAEQHRDEIDGMIRDRGPIDVPPEEEEDDEAEIQADLDEIFEQYGEVFRRLAQ